MPIKYCPSVMCADFWQLGEDIAALDKAGVDLYHVDIMDGHFVPNLMLNLDLVKTLRAHSATPLDVHLMVTDPAAYIEKAAARLHMLGAKIAVLGSGGARRLQKEYGENRGKEQFRLFFAMASAIMGEKGIRVVIEPLSHNESNYILSVPEALEIAKAVDSPFGGILCDYYHMGQEGEPTTVLPAAKGWLWHCHIAHPITRHAPLPGDGGRYEELAAALKQCEYKGNITFEGICPDSEEVFAQSVRYIKTLFQGGAACR